VVRFTCVLAAGTTFGVLLCMHNLFFGFCYIEHVLRSVLVERANDWGHSLFIHSIATVGNKSRVGLGNNKNTERIKNFTGVNFIALFCRVALT